MTKCPLCGPRFVGKCIHRKPTPATPEPHIEPIYDDVYFEGLAALEPAAAPELLAPVVRVSREELRQQYPAQPAPSSELLSSTKISSCQPTPREWWAEERLLCTVPPEAKTMFPVVHVIERSAYARVCAERDFLKRDRDRCLNDAVTNAKERDALKEKCERLERDLERMNNDT